MTAAVGVVPLATPLASAAVEPAVVQGYVTDEDTGVPIESALVLLSSGSAP